MNSSVLIYTIPCTDTTPISDLLFKYYSSTEKSLVLREYFNYQRISLDQFSNTSVIVKNNAHPQRLSPELAHIEFTKRFETLKGLKISHILKTFPFILKEEEEGFLISNYKCIFILRKNLLDYLLSYMIRQQIQSRHLLAPLKKNDLVATKRLHQEFCQYYRRLQMRIAQVQNPTLCFYEDYMSLSEQDFLTKLDLKKEITFTYSPYGPKLFWGNKLEKFKNGKDIQRWYKDSFLQELQPI